MTQNNMEVVAWAAKILRRYESDVPEVKQFLRDGEDRVLVSALTSAQAEIERLTKERDALREALEKVDGWAAEGLDTGESRTALIDIKYHCRFALQPLEPKND